MVKKVVITFIVLTLAVLLTAGVCWYRGIISSDKVSRTIVNNQLSNSNKNFLNSNVSKSDYEPDEYLKWLEEHWPAAVQEVDGNFYYYNQRDAYNYVYSGERGTNKLNFIFGEDFIISPREDKVIWTKIEWDWSNNSDKRTGELIISDIDGKDQRVIFNKEFFINKNETFPVPVKWSKKNIDKVYLADRVFNDKGGYFLTRRDSGDYINPSILNLSDNRIKEMFKEDICGTLEDISDNDDKIICVNTQLVVIDLVTNEGYFLKAPGEFKDFGNARFLDDDTIVYERARHNADDEKIQRVQVDIDGSNEKVISER